MKLHEIIRGKKTVEGCNIVNVLEVKQIFALEGELVDGDENF
jgi:hypothetical protein